MVVTGVPTVDREARIASLSMRHRVPLLLAAAALVVTACGGDDDASATETSDSSTATTTSPSARTAGSDSSAPGSVPVSIDECEDEPDPADYVVGQIPPAVRPCEIPTELGVHIIREGTGDPAADGDTIIVDYTGIRSETGLIFDTSYTRDVPLDFPLGRGGVIAGWDQGLVGATAGSAYKLDIPADLAYGDTPPPGDSGIEPGDALTFVIEVRAIIPPTTLDDAPLDLEIEPSVGATEVTTTDLTVGDGAPIELGKTAVVHMLLVRGDNEVVLLNTWERDDALQIIMEEGQTLPGLYDGLQGATVGTMRVITMPPVSAFGVGGEPSLGLPAGTDLIVVAEVVGVY